MNYFKSRPEICHLFFLKSVVYDYMYLLVALLTDCKDAYNPRNQPR